LFPQDIPSKEIPHLSVPLHTVIKLRPTVHAPICKKEEEVEGGGGVGGERDKERQRGSTPTPSTQAYGCDEERFPQDVPSVDDANSDETKTPFKKLTGSKTPVSPLTTVVV
jgi:hypothetical protein